MGWKYTKDGRLNLNGQHYKAIKMVLNAQQNGICAGCPNAITSQQAHMHHLNKRGMGGGKREDWIGNDPGLVEVAGYALCVLEGIVNDGMGSKPGWEAVDSLKPALARAKVTTVTLLCPTCHGKRHE